MAETLVSYSALSPSSSRSDVALVLQSIVDAPSFAIDATARTTLIETILKDLMEVNREGGSKLVAGDAAKALLAVKFLGRDPTGSQVLSTPINLSNLLVLSTSFEDIPEASSEALRAVANTLLLVAPARSTLLEDGVDGGRIALSKLEKATTADQIYILSRILFFCTVSRPPFVQTLVEEQHHGRTIVEIFGEKLDILTDMIKAETKMAGEAMSDLLKFIFNLLVHYPKMTASEPQTAEAADEQEPKVIGDFWSQRLDGVLPPLLRTFSSLPPTAPAPVLPPLTHVIHSLITIPVSPTLRPIWLATPSADESQSDHLDVLKRAFDLFETTLAHYMPGNIGPDVQEVRKKCEAETGDKSLDDVLSPLAVLIIRLCAGDDTCRARVRQWIVPDDLDRSKMLEGRSDTLGRCLRLLSCVYHERLKDAVGEMLFAMSGNDAWTLSALVGYGNVAGFLFSKGVVNAPPPPSSGASAPVPLTTPSGESISPITGTTIQASDLSAMSDEEKECEMEKLVVLFDRLEKTGAIQPDKNPMRKAVQKAVFGGP